MEDAGIFLFADKEKDNYYGRKDNGRENIGRSKRSI